MMKKILSFISHFLLIFLLCTEISAQTIEEGTWYAPRDLSQEPVNVTKELFPTKSQEIGDTTMTIYGNCSVDFKIYFVNGAQYDNIFNPNPTGILLNGKEFFFYCSIEKSIRQNYSNILQAKEFEYLGKKYLVLISFREDCLGDNCRYRCYNLFDITNPSSIRQTSFASIYEGVESFGEYNNDGKLDFLRYAPKPPKDKNVPDPDSYNLVTAYTVGKGKPKQLNDNGNSYYLYTQGNEEASKFHVIQSYWFFDVKNKEGAVQKKETYFAEYISFDPMYRYLYNPDGVRIEKNKWSVHITNVGDLEAAQEYCRRIQEKSYNDVFIMIDQYSGDITYQVFVGNFMHKEAATGYVKKLSGVGFNGKLTDFDNMF